MHNLALRRGLLLLSFVAFPPCLQAQQTSPERSAPAAEPNPELQLQMLDAAVPVLIPQQQRDAAVDRRIEAYAWYSTGHLLKKRRQFLRAYRAYQQAVQYDPAALPAYDSLVQLARPLRRYDDAVRYMIKAVELDPSRYNALFGLAAQFSRTENDPRFAVQLFEQARQSPDLKKDSMPYVVLMRELGRLYQRQGRPDAAADAYQTVVDALEDPERFEFDRNRLRRTLRTTPEALYTEVGEVFLAAGKADEALALFEKVRENEPDNAQISFHLAQAYLALDRAEEALVELNKHLEQGRRKTGAAAYQLQAEILEKLGRKDELIPTLEQADDDDFARKYFLAEQYRLAKQYDKAEELLIAVLLEDSQPQAAGYQGLVDIYHETRQPEKLLEHLGRTWRENKNRLDIVQSRLAAIAQDTDFVSEVIATAEKLLEEKPNDIKIGTIYGAALIARAAEQVEPTTKLYRALLDRRDDPNWYFDLGSMQFFAKRYGEAAEVFREALEKGNGGQVVFQIFLVRSLAFGGQTDEALETAKKAEQQAAEQQDTVDAVRLGALSAWVLYYAQRFEEAKEAYQRLIDQYWADWPMGLIQVEQGLPNPIREAHFALSNIYVELGDFERSAELLLRVLNDDPDDPHASNDLGYLWADQGKNLEQAELMIRKAVEAEPENGAYLDSLGWVLYRREKYTEARKHLEQATEVLEESDPVIWDHLGDVYRQLKMIKEAREAWLKAQKLLQEGDRKDPKRVDRILKKLKDTSP